MDIAAEWGGWTVVLEAESLELRRGERQRACGRGAAGARGQEKQFDGGTRKRNKDGLRG